ncbi:MAG: citramalate synthase [Candidatus Latescibacteria bacterium]|nr:citramalate synthase [Candidatus Latescibacterota bacterium]
MKFPVLSCTPKQVEIYDSTLRDGSQGEAISFSLEDKLLIAGKLDEAGFHYIEGGWPNPTNPKDLEFFKRIKSSGIKRSIVTAFGSTRRASNPPEKDSILLTLLNADTEVITIFGKSWDLHVREVLRISLDENLKLIEDSVAFLVSEGRKVFFDAEHFFDGYKADRDYALKTLTAAESGGAGIVVLCDTNGGMTPFEIEMICHDVRNTIDGIFGIHCHNDAGLSSANTLTGVIQGAVQVQGTINGIGERCGNDNLCTTIPNLSFKLGISCMKAEMIKGLMGLSRFVSEIANEYHYHRQPYVGESAFAHKGGAHIDGVIKNARTFEHIDPQIVGNQRRFLLSEQSGSATVLAKLKKIYPDLDKKGPRVKAVLTELKKKEHEGYQYEAAQGSFELLAARVIDDYKSPFSIGGFRVITDKRKEGSMVSEATIKLMVDGAEEHTASEGDGPVDALNGALRKALNRFYPKISSVHLEDYKVRVLESDEGTEAKVRVLIESSDGVDVWGTVGVSENIIDASYIALVDSLTYKLVLDKRKVEHTANE